MTALAARLAAALLAVLATTWAAAGPAGAACVPPEVSLSKRVVEPGERILVTGRAFMAECRDNYRPPPAGADGASIDGMPDPGPPSQDIEVAFEQGDDRATLAWVDAGPDYTISVEVVVPSGSRRGEGLLTVFGAVPVPVEVTEAPEDDRLPIGAAAGVLPVVALALGAWRWRQRRTG